MLPGNRDYRPLFLTSMALAWWAGGGETLPFHLVSITLHMGNVILLYLILGRIFSLRSDPVGGLPPPADAWAAFGAAALFAVHPLATESVDYISSQSVPLAVLFLLLGFYLFLVTYGWGPPRPDPATRWRLAGSYAAFFLALLSKPIAIVLPLLLLLWELALGKMREGREEPFWRHYGRRLVKHLPYFAVAIIYLAVRAVVVPTATGGGKTANAIYIHYLTQTKAMVFYYLQQAALPFDLNVDRAYPPSTSIFDAKVVLAIALFVIIAGLLYRFRRHGNVVFWTLWFPACLLLTTYVVMLGQTVNEHRVYLSLAGFCAVAGFLLVKLVGAFPLSISDLSIGRRAGGALIAVVAGLAVLGLGTESRLRNEVWASDFTLWENAANNGGTWRAHMNYGLALEAKGRAEEALFQFKEAVRLGPYAFAYLNLGNAQVRRRNFDQAITNLRTAVRLWPSSPETHLYLAYGLSRTGKPREAEAEFRRAIALRPNYLKAYRFLATFYEQQGRPVEAIEALRHLVALDPGQTWANDRVRRIEERKPAIIRAAVARKFNTAFAHQRAGRRKQAIAEYRRLLRDEPNYVQARFNLAYALSKEGDCGEAVKHFERVLELRPGYSAAHYHLAACYKALGDENKASSHATIYERGRR